MSAQRSQLDFQQSNARAVHAEDLEIMGKRASATWSAGGFKTLGEAVVDTVKHAGLAPEQVRRVIEFANTDAFLSTFNKLGSGSRYVDFGQGVLADPREVIRDLNDGGGGSVFDSGTSDYDGPPSHSKQASAKDPEAEISFYAAFHKEASTEGLPYEEPESWVWHARDKLAGEYQHLNSTLGGLEVAYQDCALGLSEQVKNAAMNGASLGQVVRAWSTVTDDPTFMKVAFQLITPRLIREGCFSDVDAVNQSIEKTGNARLVNTDHPLVTAFADYCDVLCKLSEVRQERNLAAEKLSKVNCAITKFGNDTGKLAGVVGEVLGASGRLGDAAKGYLSSKNQHALGELAGFGIKAAPVAAAAGAAKGLYDYAATSAPGMTANMYANPMSNVYKQHKAIRRAENEQNLLGG